MLIGIDGNEANRPDRVGVNQYAHGLLWGLWRFSTTHRFTIYLSGLPLPSLPPEKENWHYRVIGPPKLWTQWRLPLDLFTHLPRPDIFFSPSHYAPRASPMPTVVSVMDLGFINAREQFNRKDYLQLTNWTAYSVKNARGIIAISNATKKDIQQHYALPAGKIVVIYPGYDQVRFHPRSPGEVRKVLKKYGIEIPYLLFLGSLKPNKNVERIIEAFSLLPKKQKISLVIAGKKAWLYQSIFEKASALRLGKKVIFTGFFPEEDLPYLVSGAAAFVSPSLFEGFGIPVVESLGSGVPVVVSAVASLPEVAGGVGIYVDPSRVEDIARGIRAALSQKPSKNRRLYLNQAQKFRWEKSAADLIAALEKFV